MTALIGFLEARLTEDEAAAKAATPGPWAVNDPTFAEAINSESGTAVVAGGRWGDEASVFDSDEDAIHIARHDPARVLREVAAKRRVLARHCIPEPDDYRAKYGGELGCVGCGDWESGSADIVWNVEYIENCPELRDLAAPYSDHPDYRKEWAT